jgi:hypothetical protein
MKTASSRRSWAQVKKIGIIVAIVAGAITSLIGVIEIISTLWPAKEYNIEAAGYCSQIALPDALLDNVPTPARDKLDSIESIWWITVANEGTKEAQDLSIELPFDGYYQLEQVGTTAVFTDFQKIIDIGSLRPSNKIHVTIWAGPAYFPMSTWCTTEIYGETRITHPNGVVDIQYTEQVTGLYAWYIRTNRNTRNMLTVLIAFSIVLILVLIIINRSVKVVSTKVSSFSVDATREEGLDTGIPLQAGQQIIILGEGQISINKGHQWMNPDGMVVQEKNKGDIRCEENTYLDDHPEGGIPGALIGWIGEERDKTTFFVGEIFKGEIQYSGNLYLGVNDQRGAYTDNISASGEPTSFQVMVIVK